MYVNFIYDRKILGYQVVKDSNCGMELILITDSSVQLIRNLPLTIKPKGLVILGGSAFLINCFKPCRS